MKEIKAFKCDFCGKNKINKSLMKKHETICFHNPKTKSCATCFYIPPYGENECKVGVIYEHVKYDDDVFGKVILNTQCPKYLNNEIEYNRIIEYVKVMFPNIEDPDIKALELGLIDNHAYNFF